MNASTDDQTIEQLTAMYPGWHIWVSQGIDDRPGALMATRQRDLTDDELRAGLARTLPMGHGTDLREQLAEQARREDTMGGPA